MTDDLELTRRKIEWETRHLPSRQTDGAVSALLLVMIVLGIFAFLAIAPLLSALSARGQDAMVDPDGRPCQLGDFACGHGLYHWFYESGERGGPLMRPHQPGTSCCNVDCVPTRARYVAAEDRWEAWVQGEWIAVPRDRVKENVTNPATTAHVCASKRVLRPDGTTSLPPEIYCFVRPEGAASLTPRELRDA